MNRDIKGILIAKLSELPVYHPNDDGTEHTVRCPYCGDSKDPTHCHLGIAIDPNDDSAMLWNCFRCGAGGVVNDDLLDDLGIYISDEEVKELRNYNKKLEKLSNRRTILRTERFVTPLCQYTRENERKRMYLSNRLQLDVTYEDMQRNKIIPSLVEFMVRNDLKQIEGCPDWLVNAMEKDYLGFLSTNNNVLTFRNVNPTSRGKRYYKLFVNPLNQDRATFYSIPSQLDLLYEGPLHVHIAEGTFDILSIKYNVRPQDRMPGYHIFYASCGYSYVNILKHLIRNGILTHLNVHIYADEDKPDYEHNRFLKRAFLDQFMEHAYIHRNKFPGEKDFGVPLEAIDEKIRVLW